MNTKDELINHLKDWITIDNKILNLQKQMKEFRMQKKDLTNDLMEVMKTNEIECFDIKDGKIMYTKTKTKSPLNKKTLLTALSTYYQNNSQKAEEISNYILDSREEKERESIKRKINKEK
jgi:hypothetical protein